MQFKLWLESRFSRLPPETVNSIDVIANFIMANKHLTGSVGTISVPGRFVQVAIYPLDIKDASKYVNNIDMPDTIIVNANRLNLPIVVIKSNISHEAIHAIDPKSQFNSFGKGDYKSDIEYLQSPLEFDGYGSDVDRALRDRLMDASKPIKDRLKDLEDFKSWLRTGRSTPEIEELFNRKTFKAWQGSQTLWRRFKQRLYMTLAEIENTLKTE